MEVVPKISIITVCRNDLNGLQKTLASIRKQSFCDFEVVIIDGASNDGTQEYLRKLRMDNLIYVSEPDSGIYDAMNKGVRLASGSWYFFLNAGDLLYSSRTFQHVAPKLSKHYEFVCGRVVYNFKKALIETKPQQVINWNTRILAHQQGVFIANSVFSSLKFDQNFQLRAEAAFFYKAYLLGFKYENIDTVISYYDPYGISSRISWTQMKEGILIEPNIYSTYRIGFILKYIFVNLPKFLIRTLIKK